MPNFPISKDDATSLPNPTGVNTQNNPDHAALHTAENAAIIAAETKLGTGATVPAANQLLVGTGAGTSAWQGLTSAQLAAVLSDETGSGNAVFANTPTLITPKVDTINENTLNNGVTVGGVNLKAGVNSTANSIPTAALQDNAVTGSKLATTAIKLGYVQATANQTITNTTGAQVTGLSSTVTIPSGGRSIEITAFVGKLIASAGPKYVTLQIWDGTVGSGTQLNASNMLVGTGTQGNFIQTVAVVTPAAGSKTYNVGVASDPDGATTATVQASATQPAFLLVKVI